MPMEEEEILSAYNEIEEKFHKKLCLKLYDKANIQVVNEILTNFMNKLREKLDDKLRDNTSASKVFNYSHLENL